MCFVSEMNGFGYYFTVLGGTSSQQAALLKKDAVVFENVKETDGDSEHSNGSYKTHDLLLDATAKLDVNSGSYESNSLKEDELDNVSKSNKACGDEPSEVVVKSNENYHIRPSSDVLGNVVLRREFIKSGPRPTTFPLCLLQPEVISSSPEAQQYFQQQQEVLEEMGHQMDVTDLKDLTVPESMAVEDGNKNTGTKEKGNDFWLSQNKLDKSSSYENIYDQADLAAAICEDTPSTAQLTLGDPFTTKTQLPPEMCSSFENLYLKTQVADEKVVHKADFLAAEILEEAVQEAAQDVQMQSAAHCTLTSVSSGSEVSLPGEAMGQKGYFQTNSKKSDSEGIVVV